jgi:hypothetical protein
MTGNLGAKAALRRKVAESSPGSLMTRGFFLLGQRDLWLVAAAGLVSFAILAPYTYDFASGWVLLTIAIQLIAVWAAVVTLRATAKVEVESAIVGEVETRGSNYLRVIKSGTGARASLEQLEADVLPHNTGVPPPSMIRLFQHIFKEARDRKFDSSYNVIQPYREEVMEDIFRLQNFQKIALWLGILGTFIGLLRAIQAGDLTKSQENADLFGIVTRMFGSLFISFSASLAGLEVAVIIGAFLLLLRRRHAAYFQNMETAVVTMLSLARNATNKDDFFVEFSQMRSSMGELKDSLYHQTKELSGGMEGVRRTVERQTEQIQAGVAKLAAANAEFDRFLTRLSERQSQMLDDVKSVYDAISLRNLGTTLQASIVEAGRHISAAVEPNVKQVSEQVAKLNEALSALGETLRRQQQEAAAQRIGLEALLARQAEQSAAALRALDRRVQDGLGRIEEGNAKLLTLDMAELSRRISALNNTLERSIRQQHARRWSLRDFLAGLRS